MGTTDSKQQLGERVIAARKKLADDIKIQSERVKDIESKSPETMKVIVESVAESFKSCSPFLEPTLLVAWRANPEECGKIILDSCKRVLTAPINKNEYEWFMKYVFQSSIWMFKTKQDRFMYEELIDIANNMQKGIIDNMNSIYDHLQYHPYWKQLSEIKNQNIVLRQDDKKVGLLQQKGIRNILEMKQIDDTCENLQTFIDANLAINMLTTTAKNINQEFQNHIKTVMSHYGDYKYGPLKKVDRCLSKIENDYQNAAYPKAAKLLDLVRCSVTFNTVDQLVTGYDALMRHISKNSSTIELARVKNGFLNKEHMGGYRDIKVNVIYHSTINPHVSFICEIQLLLGQILHEKKRVHKLYSIVRQQLYFKMTVAEDDEKQSQIQIGTDKLKFEPILNVNKEVQGTEKIKKVGKCSVESDLGLLALESEGKISCIDIKEKKMIFTETRSLGENEMFTHSWVVIDGKKYLSVQTSKNTIKFFKQSGNTFIEAENLRICLEEKDAINCVEFDKTFENIIIVKNSNILEKRAVKQSSDVLVSIKLEKAIDAIDTKILSLSNDGNWCVIGSGDSASYFYLIETNKKVQHKIESKNLKASISTCFLNGEANFCLVGDNKGHIEVWDVKKKESVKVLQLQEKTWVYGLASSNNILAVCSSEQKLSLYDTVKWENFWSSKKYDMYPTSVHLTNDWKLTIGGWSGEKCMILGIK